nr:ATP-binding cassette domain-containing protein [Candidatus Microthrix sp.]
MLAQFAGFYPDPLDPARLLEQVGLAHRARSTWGKLSGGEQQRLSLALALIGRPRIAFLDEPSAGVDLEGRLLIRSLIAQRDDRVAVVLSTHDLDEAQSLARSHRDHRPGRRSPLAPRTTSCASNPGDGCASVPTQAWTPPELSSRLGALVTEASRGEYVVAAAGTPRLVATLTSALADWDVSLADLRAGRKRLDDVFLRLTGEVTDAGQPPGASDPPVPDPSGSAPGEESR